MTFQVYFVILELFIFIFNYYWFILNTFISYILYFQITKLYFQNLDGCQVFNVWSFHKIT